MTSSRTRLVSLLVLVASALVSAGCGSSSSGGGGGGTPTLDRIDVGPASISVARGATQPLTATGRYSDGSSQELASTVTWTSAPAGVVSISTTGLLSGIVSGTTTVTATLSGVSGSRSATVTGPALDRLVVNPATADVTRNAGEVALTVEAIYFDATTADVTSLVAWTSSADRHVTVAAGRVTAPAGAWVGMVSTVTATYGGKTAASVVRVVAGPPLFLDASKDPLSPEQWHLENRGQKAFADKGGKADEDLRLTSARSLGLTGKGVKVAVLDDGIEIDHEDLIDRKVDGSWNYITGTGDPAPTNGNQDHGTMVTGIAAMTYGNGKGGVGVAPGLQLMGVAGMCGSWAPEYASWRTIQALGGPQGTTGGPKTSEAWVFNQSFGWDLTELRTVPQDVEDQFAKGVKELRGGKGAVYVKAAGNNFSSLPGRDNLKTNCVAANRLGVSCGNANQDGENALPFNIVVGAVSAQGTRASYSSAGSAIWVSAPGGESGLNASLFTPSPDPLDTTPAIVTTDRTGCTYGNSRRMPDPIPADSPYTQYPGSSFDLGYKLGTADPEPRNDTCNYTNSMNGTSAAAPATTGAVALLLDARPDLTWREVKHILAKTARKVDADIPAVTAKLGNDVVYVAEPAWTENWSKNRFHNWYGFGAVDVDAALKMALTFESGSLGVWKVGTWVGGELITPVKIPDFDAAGASSTFSVTDAFTIEAVEIWVKIGHRAPGDLGIELISPKGTRSVLLNIRNGFVGTGIEGWLLSNAFYEEPSAGDWTIKVVDGTETVDGYLQGWKIRIYGH